MKLDPIDLKDDGMREQRHGEIGKGDLIAKALFVCHDNPQLIAQVAYEKSRRRTIRETNFRRFHDSFEQVAA